MLPTTLLNPSSLGGLLSLLPLKPYPPFTKSAGPPILVAMTKTLDEYDVGISCYISSLPGFRGILKHRYSDFIVNEVDCDGKIVRLTSFDLPPEEEKVELDLTPSGKDYTLELESFRSLCGEADAEALGSLLKKISSLGGADVAPTLLSPDSDKFHRAEVHNFFKKNFKFLVTDTVEQSEGSSKCIRVRFLGEGGGRSRRGKKRKDMTSQPQFDSRGAENWPEHRGKFLRFNLYKENKDTQEALGVIGKMLGIQHRSFGFAGTKDKRSISSQRVTIFKMHAKRIAALNSRLFGIKVGDFCYVENGLVLGQLLGNRFTITLRHVVADSEDVIKAAANSLERDGFINYYGLQRFGSGSVPTHLVGGALLRGEWKGAVDLILDPREGENATIMEARKHYKEHGDVDLALRKFPRYLVAERAILQCMKKCPGNYLQALKSIPRTLRMMYVHSYQSYLWNHAASARVQKYGISQVVLGDLVLCKESSHVEEAATDSNSELEDCHSDVDNCPSDVFNDALPEEEVQFVKVVDSNDLLEGIYTFEDIVLPLPGSRILYPANEVASIYHDMAKLDGISLTESSHGAKDFSITNMKGAYRRVFQRPMDFSRELLTYTDDNAPLAESDLDKMSKIEPCDLTKKVSANGKSVTETKEFESEGSLDTIATDNQRGSLSSLVKSFSNLVPESTKMALKLEFTLPASCYATMAIRELLKTSTSVAFHKTMNP